MKPALLLLALVIVAHASAGEPALRGKLLDTIPGAHSGSLRQIAFSPDGKYLACRSSEKAITLWDVARRAPVTHLPLQEWPDDLAFSADSRSVAVAVGQTVTIWDVLGGKQTTTLKLKLPVHALAFSPDGQSLVVKDLKNIGLWDLASGTVTRTFKSPTFLRDDRQVAFSPDGRTVMVRSSSGIDRWDAATGKLHGTIRYPVISSHTFPMAYSTDGKSAVIATGAGVTLWDAAEGKQLKILVPPPEQNFPAVVHLALSRDGKRLAVGSQYAITLLDLATGKQTATIKARLIPGGQTALAFSPDGKLLAGITHVDANDVELWDAASGAPVGRLRHYPGGQTLTFSHDGKTLAAVNRNVLDFWEVATRTHRKGLFANRPGAAQDAHFVGVSFSPDGKCVVGTDNDPKVDLFDAAELKHVAHFVPNQNVRSVAVHPDGKTLALGGIEVVKLWDVTTKKSVAAFPGTTNVRFVAFDREGKTLAAAMDWPVAERTFMVWDVKSGKKLADFPLVEKDEPLLLKDELTWQALALAFSPDGKTVAAAGATGIVKLWDAATGKRVGALKAHEGRIYVLKFSPDGKVLASGGADKVLKLWDVASRKEVSALRGHAGSVFAVAFSPTQPLVVVGAVDTSGKSALYFWELSPAKK